MAALWSCFPPSTSWVLGIELKLWGLATHTFAHWVVNSLIYTLYVCTHAMEVRGHLVELALSFSYIHSLGIELRSWELAANTFLCWAISLANFTYCFKDSENCSYDHLEARKVLRKGNWVVSDNNLFLKYLFYFMYMFCRHVCVPRMCLVHMYLK